MLKQVETKVTEQKHNQNGEDYTKRDKAGVFNAI